MSARRELARLSSPSQRGFRIVAVTSGKGGVGKTTISVNLALALHHRDHRVLLVDADMGLGNVHVLVGKQPKRTLANFVAGQGSIVDAILPGPNGMDILYGGSGMPHLANLTRTQMQSFVHELTKLSDSYDFVIVDTAAGIAPNVLDYLSIADEILVVTTPDLSAILDAYGMIKSVRESHLPAEIHGLVNQVADEKEANAVFSRLSACTQKFLSYTPRPIGFVEKDERILQAGRRRVPYILEDPTQVAAKQIIGAADVFSSRRKRSIDQ
jgi:flagellar biosynthesis protein FlhG